LDRSFEEESVCAEGSVGSSSTGCTFEKWKRSCFKEHCRRDVLEFSEEFDKYLIFVTEEEMKRDDS